MNNSMLSKRSNPGSPRNGIKPVETRMETLTAFIRDTEHELLSLVTEIQAHLDLLHGEQIRNKLPVDRFALLNHAVERLTTDTAVLASVSEIAQKPQPKKKLLLQKLMQEVVGETTAEFDTCKVGLTSEIVDRTILSGNAAALKFMITRLILAVLHECKQAETVIMRGLTRNGRIVLLFDRGSKDEESEFKTWRLGKLHLLPQNGDGIALSAVDAIARFYHGHLCVRNTPDLRAEYRLTFMF